MHTQHHAPTAARSRNFADDKQRHWPGTSKWNKIEHRLFSQITLGWRGRPLTSHDVVVNTIGAVTTATGLTVTAVLDTSTYPTGTKISDAQMKDLEQRALTRHRFHGDWNYAFPPPCAPPAAPAARAAAGPARPVRPGHLEPPRADRPGPRRPGRPGRRPGPPVRRPPRAAPLRPQRPPPRPPAAGGGRNRKIDLPGHVIATRLRAHLDLPGPVIAALLGADKTTISPATTLTQALLAALPATSTRPPPRPPASPAHPGRPPRIRRPARHHHPRPRPQPAHHRSQAHYSRDTPQTHLTLECLPRDSNAPS